MSIRYLNDSQNSIQYTDKNGESITKNPFDPEYNDISTRLAMIYQGKAKNMNARKNYEDAVRNLQVSIDAGRLTVATAAPQLAQAPEQDFWPEDYTLPKTTIPWDPPLLTLRPPTNVIPMVGLGPDSPARLQPGSTAPAALTEMHLNALNGVVTTLTNAGPLLAEILAILKAFGIFDPAKTPPPAA